MRWSAIVLCLAACGDDAATTDAVADAAEVEAEVIVPVSAWTIGDVMARSGRQLQAAVSADGEVAVAAYAEAGEPDGPCEDDAAAERTRWALSFAREDGDGWAVEEVTGIVHLGAPRGFDLAFAADGTAHVAALVGDPIPFYCGANDLGLYTRAAAGWTSEVIVRTSAEAATGEPASDFGQVVGLWPALTFDAGGAAVVLYKDVHGGGLQGDDFKRADLEGAWREGAGWAHRAIDWGAGAGDFNQVVIDADGRVVALMFHPRDELVDSLRGLWVLRSADAGVSWERVRVFAGGVAERPSLAVDRSRGLRVAWYDGEVGLPYVASLAAEVDLEDEAAWEVEDVGDRVFDEGRHPAIAVSEDGVVALAYQRCGRASDGIGDCNPARDAVMFAWQDGDLWEREVVEEEADGLCGGYIDLVFSGEAPVVFYECQVGAGDGTFTTVLRAARRRAL